MTHIDRINKRQQEVVKDGPWPPPPSQGPAYPAPGSISAEPSLVVLVKKNSSGGPGSSTKVQPHNRAHPPPRRRSPQLGQRAAGGQVWEQQPGVLTQLSVISCPFIHMEGFFIEASRASLSCLHKGRTQPAGLPTLPANLSQKILDPRPLTVKRPPPHMHSLGQAGLAWCSAARCTEAFT